MTRTDLATTHRKFCSVEKFISFLLSWGDGHRVKGNGPTDRHRASKPEAQPCNFKNRRVQSDALIKRVTKPRTLLADKPRDGL